MTDGIHNIGSGSSYGIGGYFPNNKRDDVKESENKEQTTNANTERKDVNPDDVMKFLANNNYFMPVKVENAQPAAEVNGVDAETAERIAGYMERFEEIYAIIEQEFGTELAPTVMDLVMDKLMGMA